VPKVELNFADLEDNVFSSFLSHSSHRVIGYSSLSLSPISTYIDLIFAMRLILLLLCSYLAAGFTPTLPALQTAVQTNVRSSSSLYLSDPTAVDAAVDSARKVFYLWFFGGSGGAGLGISAFPGMYRRFSALQSLQGQGPTLGGEDLGISPLCGLPEDLKRKDVEKILNKKMAVDQMVNKGPKDSFWAQRGYLRLEAFQAANKDCNPLAVRTVFDAMSTGTSNVEPDVAQKYLDDFKGDIESFKRTLLWSKFRGYGAIAAVMGLLGLTASVCGQALVDGWFPEWPGRENFPLSIFGDPGLMSIKDYWI
jgi:hypothetical protein